MKINCESIGHYTAWMDEGRSFSIAGYSDAEWFCVMGGRDGEKTGFGQTLDHGHGRLLLDVLRRRQGDPTFVFAVPKVLYDLPAFCDHQIDWFLGREDIRIEATERDMITDDLARGARLFTLMRSASRRGAVLVGNADLAGVGQYLPLQHFVPTSSPDLHLEPGGIDRAVAECVRYGRPGAYLVSAGVSAAVIIDRLHGAIRDSCFIDCGSIWDAFVGIGGQREWRARLYADPQKHAAWIRSCTRGK